MGTVHGPTYEDGTEYSIANPSIQAKYLVRKPSARSWPGLAVSAGAIAPVGNGAFKPHDSDTFAYALQPSCSRKADSVWINGNAGSLNHQWRPHGNVGWSGCPDIPDPTVASIWMYALMK